MVVWVHTEWNRLTMGLMLVNMWHRLNLTPFLISCCHIMCNVIFTLEGIPSRNYLWRNFLSYLGKLTKQKPKWVYNNHRRLGTSALRDFESVLICWNSENPSLKGSARKRGKSIIHYKGTLSVIMRSERPICVLGCCNIYLGEDRAQAAEREHWLLLPESPEKSGL